MSEKKTYKAEVTIVCGKQYHVPAGEVVDTSKLEKDELKKLLSAKLVKEDKPEKKGA